MLQDTLNKTQSLLNESPDAGVEKTIEFFGKSGQPLRADLYRPRVEGEPPTWALVVCPGYGSVKELMTPWARALADRGFVVLVVGYQGYGDSPGSVGRIFPDEHVEDTRAAVRWIRASENPAPDSVALLGVSYGGAVATQAAALETGVDALISIVGYGSGSRHLRALRRYSEWLELLSLIEEDRVRRVTTGSSARISLNEILLRDEEAQEWRERVEEEHPGMRFDVTVESVDRLLEFAPENYVPFDRALPYLIIHAGQDSVVPVEEATSLYALADAPKRLEILEGIEHHAVHGGEPFERCLGEIESFLREQAAAGEPVET